MIPHVSTERSSPQLIRLIGRAVRLRCPHCGRASVFAAWFRRHERCGACGFRFARTGDDYFTGAMFFNLVLAEGIFAIGMLAVVLLSWPDVPWDRLTYGAVAGMVLAPILLHPYSQVIFLTLDVVIRPVRAAECVR